MLTKSVDGKKEHFEAISNIAPSSESSFEKGSTTTSSKITTPCPSLVEIKDAIKKVKPTKPRAKKAKTLRIIVEVEWRSSLYMQFVDFKKAFDTINRVPIWLALSRKGVLAKIIRLIITLCENYELTVLHNGNVRQVCPLSPLLFGIVLDSAMSEFTLHKRGIVWSFTRHLEGLYFADDICLLSYKLTGMQAKANAGTYTIKPDL
ncbi:uncharacterized protein LOC128861936 [Anastrepha ludens]|uniref:uncharacterized protein LOC128861936 n=1 Tax=Anastrepha ludens TaxID=28586 RepID=UPI0023AE7958|nr:uncharacterized protein LOC128861936 [Anastrepha ludens]